MAVLLIIIALIGMGSIEAFRNCGKTPFLKTVKYSILKRIRKTRYYDES